MRLTVISFRSPANVYFKSLRSISSHHLLDQIPQPTPNTHTPFQTLQILLRSNLSSTDLDPAALVFALKSSRGRTGTQLHALALSTGLVSFVPVSNSVINMYSKSGSPALAYRLFTEMPNPDTVSYNTILSSSSSGFDALDFLVTMHRSGVRFDAVAFTTALAVSADIQELDIARQLHSLVSKSGWGSDTFVGNSLITAYSRSARLDEAKSAFHEMATRDLVSWNALLSGLTQEGNSGSEAIRVFVKMLREEGLKSDHVSFASTISACVQEGSFEIGFQVHCFTTKLGLETCISVSNVLMSLYYKYGSVECAKKVFENMRGRDVISWTTMISMDADNAVRIYNAMRFDTVQPNEVTFVALIYAISAGHLLREGQMIHGICSKSGISGDTDVANSLITMYAKLESMEDSRKIFESMSHLNIVSWNSIITGYAQNGLCEEALKMFSSSMVCCIPNQYTFGSILSAITAVQTVSLTYGKICHGCIIKLGLNTGEYVSGALIDMYSKRGSIVESQRVFDETIQKSLISWTAIISAHAKHGNYLVVMRIFEDMLRSGIRPDHVTFLAVLMACGGKGMVDIGLRVFDVMIIEYKMDPWPEHYACVVDMLGRAGRLAEAEDLVGRMPKGQGSSALQSLLGACRVHGDVEMGERVADALMEMEPTESGSYVLISNLLAEKGKWESVAKVRRTMRERGVKKEVGFSWVDTGVSVRNSIHMHQFSSDDKSHPLVEEIYRVADCLGLDMLEENSLICCVDGNGQCILEY